METWLRGLAAGLTTAGPPPQARVGREYDTLESVGHSGGWTLRRGIKRGTQSRATVWEHLRGYEDSEALARGAAQLARLRHPGVVRVDMALEESRERLLLATESLEGTLTQLGPGLHDVEVRFGVAQLARTLQFLHGANLVHGALDTDAILLTERNEWKLAGFMDSGSAKEDDVCALGHILRKVHSNCPKEADDLVQGRLGLDGFLEGAYFSGLLVSTLRFLGTLAEQPAPAKAAFMRGLPPILSQFPDRVAKRQVLPLLLEQLSDHSLLALTLPNVFAVCGLLDPGEFAGRVRQELGGLFQMDLDTQATLVVLDNLGMLYEQCPRVMGLVYAALTNTEPSVQDRALRNVAQIGSKLPQLDIREELVPRLLHLYGRTGVLSLKVRALECFGVLVPLLDRTLVADRLVPLLGRTKSRDPILVSALLDVYGVIAGHLDVRRTGMVVVPLLWTQLLMDPRVLREQFDQGMRIVQEIHGRVVEELRPREQAFGYREESGEVGGEESVDFVSLVRGPRAREALSAGSSGGSGEVPSRGGLSMGSLSLGGLPMGGLSLAGGGSGPESVEVELLGSSENFALPPPPSSKPASRESQKPVQKQPSAQPMRLQFGAVAPRGNRPQQQQASQKHTGGKAADLGEFDPFA